jgi:hypothetical protein
LLGEFRRGGRSNVFAVHRKNLNSLREWRASGIGGNESCSIHKAVQD